MRQYLKKIIQLALLYNKKLLKILLRNLSLYSILGYINNNFASDLAIDN